ncbi:MAG: hypothetical protein IT249_12080 [Chitinophagaceae bacterium]|nr:hypothetical protein [Chitinophagaceae bacterium]
MKIDSNNYETFFLLYADNELNAEDHAMVEQFIEEHPEIRNELHLLTQTKLLKEDTLTYPYKADLFKHAGTTRINEINYKEHFLLYIDGELNADECKSVEVFAALHKDKQAELSLLQQIKIIPEENIAFNNKQILYRTEKNPTRVIPMRWASIAAAAAVLLTGIAIWTNINDNETPETAQPSILAGKTNIKDVTKGREQIKQQDNAELLNNADVKERNETTKADKIEGRYNNANYPIKSREIKTTDPLVNIQEKIADKEKGRNNIAAIPADEHKMEAITNSAVNADKQIALSDIPKPAHNIKPLMLDQQAFDGEDKTPLHTEVKNNENTVFLYTDNNEKKPKGKLRGLLRKASRFVDHITNTGNGNDQSIVRVGSFEIAKK